MTHRWAIGVAILAALACSVTAHAKAPPWRPSPELVARIDSRIDIPAASGGPRQRFDRWYADAIQDGRRVVEVELENLLAGPHQIHIVDEAKMPAIGDGGCGLIYATYDVETRRLSPLTCNPIGPFRPPPPPG